MMAQKRRRIVVAFIGVAVKMSRTIMRREEVSSNV
jgi:hypothetical protein